MRKISFIMLGIFILSITLIGCNKKSPVGPNNSAPKSNTNDLSSSNDTYKIIYANNNAKFIYIVTTSGETKEGIQFPNNVSCISGISKATANDTFLCLAGAGPYSIGILDLTNTYPIRYYLKLGAEFKQIYSSDSIYSNLQAPRLSPNNQEIVWSGYGPGCYSLYVRKSNGEIITENIPQYYHIKNPCWLSDQQIIFCGHNFETNKRDLCIINNDLDLTSIQIITSFKTDHFPTDTTDDGYVLLSGDENNPEIAKMNISDTSDYTTLSNFGENAHYSHDKQKIVFTVPQSSSIFCDIYIMNHDGSNKKKVKQNVSAQNVFFVNP